MSDACPVPVRAPRALTLCWGEGQLPDVQGTTGQDTEACPLPCALFVDLI